MECITAALITGIVTFAATNVDDILVLTVFYCQVNGTLRKRHIVAGQYLGFSALVLISLLGFLIGLVVPHEWIGLLGLIPIAIGIRKFLYRHAEVGQDQMIKLEVEAAKSSFLSGLFSRQTFSVAAVTFANGGDNIGIYTPLFASSSSVRVLVLLGVFFVLLGMWCYFGYRLACQSAVAQAFSRYGHIFVPFILVALGLYIMVESGTFNLLKL
jgi:cadmium resistance transport/sequestration family protein